MRVKTVRLQVYRGFDIQVRDPSWWGWETMTDHKDDRPYTQMLAVLFEKKPKNKPGSTTQTLPR